MKTNLPMDYHQALCVCKGCACYGVPAPINPNRGDDENESVTHLENIRIWIECKPWRSRANNVDCRTYFRRGFEMIALFIIIVIIWATCFCTAPVYYSNNFYAVGFCVCYSSYVCFSVTRVDAELQTNKRGLRCIVSPVNWEEGAHHKSLNRTIIGRMENQRTHLYERWIHLHLLQGTTNCFGQIMWKIIFK